MMERSAEGLPIIDLSPDLAGNSELAFCRMADHVANACEEAGCFYIKNHGVDSSLINCLYRDLRIFFAEPLEYKIKYKMESSFDRGYFSSETQNVHAFMGRPNLPNDPVEKLAFRPPYKIYPPEPETVYPDRPETLKENVRKYYESMRDLTNTLARIFAKGLGLADEGYFSRSCRNAEHLMRGNFYPGQSKSKPKPMQTSRMAEHFDITPFTILSTDDCPNSLLVKNATEEWVYANPIPGAFFVNLGDVLQRWTNHKWKATMHKVVWPEGNDIPDRLSIGYFVKLNADTIIECIPSCCPKEESPIYEPVSFYDYINGPMTRLSKGY